MTSAVRRSGAITYGRFSPRRGGWRIDSWWGKAFVRAVEERASDGAQLRAGRALARSGRISGLIVDAGSVVASVEDPNAPLSSGESGLFAVRIDLPVLDAEARGALLEVLAASPVRVGGLLDGTLPHDLVEYAEEAGAELIPYGDELASLCSCRHWQDTCVHALGVLHQIGWLIDADPLVLFHLRGVSRADVVAAGHAAEPSADAAAADADATATDAAARAADARAGDEAEPLDDVEVALDAALRAQALLDELPGELSEELPEELSGVPHSSSAG